MDIQELNRQQSQQRHPWEIVRVRVLKYFINKYATDRKHILDIGSGDAYVLKELCKEEKEGTYTAVDTAYTENIITQIQEEITCNINFLPQLPAFLNPKPGTILLLDVLEHCRDDASVLKNIFEKN